MKWAVLLLVLASVVAVPALLSGRDEGCRGSYAFSPGGFRDASVRGPGTPEEALGTLLDEAASTTREDKTDREGFHVAVFRGFDADGHLLKRIEIRQLDDGRWYEGASQVCAAQ